jgi:hypothetical protein
MRNAIRYKGLMVSVGMLLFSAFFYASSYMIKDSALLRSALLLYPASFAAEWVFWP